MTNARTHIAVGVDGSPASLDALRWTIGQAKMTGADIDAITAWQTPSEYGMEGVGADLDWADLAQQTLDTALAEVGNQDAVEIHGVVRQGHPTQVLVQASAGAELLVVGSRGRGGFAGLLLGSVSEHVSAHARCPVLVVRHQSASASAEPELSARSS
jgi:nucleotide-binding universal stress UspA family protein